MIKKLYLFLILVTICHRASGEAITTVSPDGIILKSDWAILAKFKRWAMGGAGYALDLLNEANVKIGKKCTKINSDITKINTKVIKLEAERRTIEYNITNLAQTIDSKNQEKDQLSNEIQSLVKTMNTKPLPADVDIDEIESQIKNNNKTLSKLQAEIAKLMQENNKATQKRLKVDATLLKLNNQKTTLAETLASLMHQMEVNEEIKNKSAPNAETTNAQNVQAMIAGGILGGSGAAAVVVPSSIGAKK